MKRPEVTPPSVGDIRKDGSLPPRICNRGGSGCPVKHEGSTACADGRRRIILDGTVCEIVDAVPLAEAAHEDGAAIDDAATLRTADEYMVPFREKRSNEAKRACGCAWDGPACDHERIHKDTSRIISAHPLGGVALDKAEAEPAEEWWLAFDHVDDSLPFAFRSESRARKEINGLPSATAQVRGPFVHRSVIRTDYPIAAREAVQDVLVKLQKRAEGHRSVAEHAGNIHTEIRATAHIRANECDDIALALAADLIRDAQRTDSPIAACAHCGETDCTDLHPQTGSDSR